MDTAGGCQLHKDTGNKFDRTGETANRRDGKKNYQPLVEALRATPLRLGQVNFINCLPINLPIELGEVNINANIVSGVPSELNSKILKGEIDIAPVSSVTYLENKDKLTPIGDLCIASDGPSDSVLLFSSLPIEELGGANIALSHASSTSNKLLEIIFKEFLKINCTFEMPINDVIARSSPKADDEAMTNGSEYPAYLLIGDHALSEYSKMPRNIFIYDLGSLWKKYTGFPMVFGIWVAHRNVEMLRATSLLTNQLQQAKEMGLGPLFDKVIKKAQEKVLLSKDFYKNYFEHLKYEMTDECQRGLEIFEELCIKKFTVSV